MEQAPVAHENIIAHALQALGTMSMCDFTYELLTGGVSQSFTYALNLGKDALVLKATLPGSASEVMGRAQREALFYHHLAGRVPLRVPRVLDTNVGDEVGRSPVYILMARYQPSQPPGEWREGQFVEAAGQIASLHAAFWDRTGDLRELPWLKREQQTPIFAPDRAVEGAQSYWRDLQQAKPAGAVPDALETLQNLRSLRAILRSFPLTLCHGDCHAGNVLVDGDGGMVWADWQDVGLGRGPVDLSFFMERSYFAGAAVPHASVIRAYREALEAATGQPFPEPEVRHAMVAAELLSWLLAWPPFLPWASAEQLSRVLQRVAHLAEQLFP
ncbi:MAG: aminoglycoside phosphotransferase family protein [Chloroflexia bacterium]